LALNCAYDRMNALLLFLLALGIDRFSKAWALKTLAGKVLAPCWCMNFLLTWNRGISWSLFETTDAIGATILTSLIGLTVVAFAAYTVWRTLHFHPVAFEALVLGGALSNLIDRLFYGAVIDFIELHAGLYAWPVFNVADMAIVIGVMGMMLRAWQEEPQGCGKR